MRDAEAKAEEKFFSDGNLPKSRVGCKCGSSSVGRATAFQAVGRGFEPRLPLRKMGYGPPGWLSAAGRAFPAKGLRVRGLNTSRCSSGVEHFLGKEEVVSSILINGSYRINGLDPWEKVKKAI